MPSKAWSTQGRGGPEEAETLTSVALDGWWERLNRTVLPRWPLPGRFLVNTDFPWLGWSPMSLAKQLPKNPPGLIFGKMQLPLRNFLFVGCGGSCLNPALFHLQLSLHTTHHQLTRSENTFALRFPGRGNNRWEIFYRCSDPTQCSLSLKGSKAFSVKIKCDQWHFSGFGSWEWSGPVWSVIPSCEPEDWSCCSSSSRWVTLNKCWGCWRANLGNCIMSPWGKQKVKDTILSILL